MKKINLKSSELISRRKTSGDGNTSLLLGVLIILISLGAYGAVLFLKSSTETEISKTQDEIEILKKKMDSDESLEVYDFQDRLFEIEDMMKTKFMQGENLAKISVFTLPGTSFNKITTKVLGGGMLNVEAEILTPDHYALSQQLEAYSLMEEAHDVILDNSKQEEDGIESKIIFKIQNK